MPNGKGFALHPEGIGEHIIRKGHQKPQAGKGGVNHDLGQNRESFFAEHLANAHKAGQNCENGRHAAGENVGNNQPAVADHARQPQLFIAGGIRGQGKGCPQRIQDQRQKGHGAVFAHGGPHIQIGKAIQIQAVQRSAQQANGAAFGHFAKAAIGGQHGEKIDQHHIDLIAGLQRKAHQAQNSGNI